MTVIPGADAADELTRSDQLSSRRRLVVAIAHATLPAHESKSHGSPVSTPHPLLKLVQQQQRVVEIVWTRALWGAVVAIGGC